MGGFYNRRRFHAGFQVLPRHDPSSSSSSSPPASTSGSHSSSSNPPESAIRVEFVRRTLHSYCRQPYGSRSRLLLEEKVTALKTSSDRIHPQEAFLSSSSSYSSSSYNTIVDNLSKLGVDGAFHKQIAEQVIDLGRRVSGSVNCIGVEIRLVHEHIHEETQSETEFINRYEEEGGGGEYGMVAASVSAIRSLKCKTITSSDEACCTVCLKDMPIGSKATSMPCSHLFHRDCIVTWLNNSNSCPVCRFKLPTT